MRLPKVFTGQWKGQQNCAANAWNCASNSSRSWNPVWQGGTLSVAQLMPSPGWPPLSKNFWRKEHSRENSRRKSQQQLCCSQWHRCWIRRIKRVTLLLQGDEKPTIQHVIPVMIQLCNLTKTDAYRVSSQTTRAFVYLFEEKLRLRIEDYGWKMPKWAIDNFLTSKVKLWTKTTTRSTSPKLRSGSKSIPSMKEKKKNRKKKKNPLVKVSSRKAHNKKRMSGTTTTLTETRWWRHSNLPQNHKWHCQQSSMKLTSISQRLTTQRKNSWLAVTSWSTGRGMNKWCQCSPDWQGTSLWFQPLVLHQKELSPAPYWSSLKVELSSTQTTWKNWFSAGKTTATFLASAGNLTKLL